MRNSKGLYVLSLAALTSVSALAGCDGKKGETEKAYFGFSVGVQSGLKTLEVGDTTQVLKIYTNGVDTSGRSYTFRSSNPEVADVQKTSDTTAKIILKKEGSVNFRATEEKSGDVTSLGGDIDVVAPASQGKASGGYNFSTSVTGDPYKQKAEVLGKLEKYAIDSHLTGITLFDNGGEVKYSPRVELAYKNYISGYGFGLLYDGKINNEKETKGIKKGDAYSDYYHTAMSQDPLKINQYSATGSQVGDLASYITSTYWSTRRSSDPKLAATKYEWYPCLATKEVYKPTVDASGKVTYSNKLEYNETPIPMEYNDMGLYKKWRIYVKAADKDLGRNDPNAPIRFHNSYCGDEARKEYFDNMAVTIDDYEFIYMLLLTGKNQLIRGTEMANDTSHGIKGAQRFFNETKSEKITDEEVIAKWEEFKNSNKLGIHSGFDQNGAYLDIELINAIDPFTAMYTLSSSLVSPLPRDFFINGTAKKAIASTMNESAKYYGTFGSATITQNGDIMKYTLACGPYQLEKWDKEQLVLFKRNDDWFEHKDDHKYNIAGIYNLKVDTKTDSEKVWKEFNDNGSLDVTSIPISKVGQVADTLETQGDSTFKLNVNSCTQEQWNKLKETVFPKEASQYSVKKWMSNTHFLDGLFFAINREEFATKRGVQPSLNYFSDAYLINPKTGDSYNKTEEHQNAIKYYHTVSRDGKDNYGFDYARAVDNFRIAVNELTDSGAIKLGTKEKPYQMDIHIRWMYETDIKEYGEDIGSYIEKAFNDPAVCGGLVKLNIKQEAVTNWEDVYNKYMMTGNFDLAFGAISGNTYDPLNFMEVLKSDNSSSFTLNWGTDTSSATGKNPIIYNNQRWSFDSLWTVADHGGIVKDGEKVEPVEDCHVGLLAETGTTSQIDDLENGFDVEIPLEFVDLGDTTDVEFKFERLDAYVTGLGNVELKGAKYEDGVIKATVSSETAQEIKDKIIQANKWEEKTEDKYKHPFNSGKYNVLWSFEVYYELKIGGENGSSTEGYTPVSLS